MEKSSTWFACVALCVLTLSGCASHPLATERARPSLSTPEYNDLRALPEPRGPITVSVYGFKDLTGQYKSQENFSSFSTAVTQGASAMLIQTLTDTRWFIPVEREGLNNILTERKIIRAAKGEQSMAVPPLQTAQIILEGGIISYETSLHTGGLGLGYHGIALSGEYRKDQVSVYLRAVDVRSGQVLQSVSTTKSIFSKKIDANFFRFVSFKRLAEAEIGYTTNEPVQRCVLQAIQKAVSSLIIEGLLNKRWALKNPEEMSSPVISDYLADKTGARGETQQSRAAEPGNMPDPVSSMGASATERQHVTDKTDQKSLPEVSAPREELVEANEQSSDNRLPLDTQRQLRQALRKLLKRDASDCGRAGGRTSITAECRRGGSYL